MKHSPLSLRMLFVPRVSDFLVCNAPSRRQPSPDAACTNLFQSAIYFALGGLAFRFVRLPVCQLELPVPPRLSRSKLDSDHSVR